MPPKRCAVDDAANFIDLLTALVAQDVNFIVVGGVAEILAGSPLVAVELELVYSPSKKNIQRLMEALRRLDARYYDELTSRPDIARLAEQSRHLFLTDLGLLCVSSMSSTGQGFAELAGMATEYELEDIRVRTPNLESLIEARKRSSSPEDHYALRFLRQIFKLTHASVYEAAMVS